MLQDDVYELALAWAQVMDTARFRGHYTQEDLTLLEDIAHALAFIVTDEMRAMQSRVT